MNNLTRGARLAVLVAALAVTTAWSHGLLHQVSHSDAVVVTITHEDGEPFADQHYQVYYGRETVAFESGRTDALGRVTFVPDRAGEWRIRAFSQDGHGVDITIDSAGPGSGAGTTGPSGRWSRVVVGASLLFGIFGLLALFTRRRRA